VSCPNCGFTQKQNNNFLSSKEGITRTLNIFLFIALALFVMGFITQPIDKEDLSGFFVLIVAYILIYYFVYKIKSRILASLPLLFWGYVIISGFLAGKTDTSISGIVFDLYLFVSAYILFLCFKYHTVKETM
jgi:hypothetical protein